MPKPENSEARGIKADEKVANLLALLVTKDAPITESVVILTRAGFTAEEVASLLGTTVGSVRQQNYAARNRKPRPKRRPEA